MKTYIVPIIHTVTSYVKVRATSATDAMVRVDNKLKSGKEMTFSDEVDYGDPEVDSAGIMVAGENAT